MQKKDDVLLLSFFLKGRKKELSGLLWHRLALFGPVWHCLPPFGTVWHCSALVGTNYYHQFGAIVQYSL